MLKKNTLAREITTLKGDYLINGDAIANLELELNQLIDAELAERIKAMKLFEGLNSEKPSAVFLSLAKKRNTGSLKVIRDVDNVPFRDESSRNEFIVSFYESLYRKPDSEPDSHLNVIENFLGPDILNNDIVKNSKPDYVFLQLLHQEKKSIQGQNKRYYGRNESCVRYPAKILPKPFPTRARRLCWQIRSQNKPFSFQRRGAPVAC